VRINCAVGGGLAVSLGALALAGCDTLPPVASAQVVAPATAATVQDPADIKYYASDESLRMCTEDCNRSN